MLWWSFWRLISVLWYSDYPMPSDDLKTLYLIDGHAQIFRAYHAIRGGMSSPVTGEPTNATFGFVGMLLKLYREHHPDYIVMTIDVSGDRGTFRTELDSEYKATRDAPPEDLAPQTERIIEICELFGIPVLGVEGVEADDVIASVVDRLTEREDLLIRIVSRDKDLQQLLGDRVEMFDIHKDQTLNVQTLIDDKGITPEQVVDVLALMGDNVDNIPGVQGVGPKTAAKWIAEYGSIDELLNHLDDLTGKQREKVEAAKDRLDLNRRLVTLRRDVEIDFDLDASATQGANYPDLLTLFKQLGFNRHLEDLQTLSGGGVAASAATESQDAMPDGLFGSSNTQAVESKFQQADPDSYAAITTQEQLDALVEAIHAMPDDAPLAVDTETTAINAMAAELCGICLALPQSPAMAGSSALAGMNLADKRGYYIPVRSPKPDDHLDADTVVNALRPILEDPAIPKVGQNLKYDWLILRNAGVNFRGMAFDTMVASYLIDATRSSHKLDNLALAFLDYEMIPIDRLIGSGKKQIRFDEVPLEQAVTYAAEDADVTLRLRETFTPKLKQMGLTKLFDELEMPLVEVLAELEYNGILVEPGELDRQQESMARRIVELRDSIIDTAGVAFNPDSPKQLSDVLFNKLACKPYRKTKTGASTDSETLQRIVDEQEGDGATVAELILEYRQLTKLVGTYLEALKSHIHPTTGRIHSSFSQTVTATGRLASSDPNLQNIPIRTDLGRQIRKAFVAPEGRVLLGADYSQIELRILAHLSQDPGLIEAFESDQDIHRAVAAEVFGANPDDVTDEQRSAAKMVNFGIVYGITPYGLARRLTPGAGKDEIKQAEQIINDYKKRYPKIDKFLDQCVETAKTKGYVETIMKRRRPIPEIHDRGNRYALGQRMAINTVVQGSAADLIKVAMVKLHRRIHADDLPLKMLLQIHDELVFECPEGEIEAMTDLVKQEMESAMDLSVPIKAEAHHGTNWFEAK